MTDFDWYNRKNLSKDMQKALGYIPSADRREAMKESQCRVKVCHAVDCRSNKDFKCTLDAVEIERDGSCKQYILKDKTGRLTD